jgi:hypothetical protein
MALIRIDYFHQMVLVSMKIAQKIMNFSTIDVADCNEKCEFAQGGTTVFPPDGARNHELKY